MRLRDAVMLAMLPVLQQQQPRKSPRDLVRDAYEFGDEAAWQSSFYEHEMADAIATVDENALLQTGCSQSPVASKADRRRYVGRRNHRWNVATGTCDYCRQPPLTLSERRALMTARRNVRLVLSQERAV